MTQHRMVALEWDYRHEGEVTRYRRGDVFEVPADHVDRLLRAGAIEVVGAPADVTEPPDEISVPGVPSSRPPQTAPKARWVEWAVSNGLDRDEAEQLSKADLVAL